MKSFKNIFEVRKALRFGLIPGIINRKNNIDLIGDGVNLKNTYEKYEEFLDLLEQNLYEKEEIIQNTKANYGYKPFANLGIILDLEIEESENKEKKYFINFNNTIQFLYKGLEEVFTNDWIENKQEIKYNKNGNKKQQNYIIFDDLGNNNFVKKYFEEFIKESTENIKKLKKYVDENSYNKSRKSDILFLIQKINSREHLGKLHILFEKNFIQHKNNSKAIYKLKYSLLSLKENIGFLMKDLQSSQSFGLPIEHISLNYYSVNKTPKELDEEIAEKIEKDNLETKYKWIINNDIFHFGTLEFKSNQKVLKKIKAELDKIIKEKIKGLESKRKEELDEEIKKELSKLTLGELKEILKLFKAKQKSALLEQLQKDVLLDNLLETDKKKFKKFKFKFMREEYDNFEITLFDDVKNKKNGKEFYIEMLSLTRQIEKETNKETIKILKMKRGKYFQFKLKDFINFSNFYKQVSQKYGFKNAELKSLERQKIDATKLRGWGFLSKNGKNYFINTFDIENTKEVFKKINNINEDGNDIKIYILSSITLRAFDKLCFKKDSSFIKGLKVRNYKESYKVNEGARNEKNFWRLKSKKLLLEEGILIKFYINVLKQQKTLNIQYRNDDSIKNLENSLSLEDFEINLKLETYNFIEKSISKNTFESFINKYKGNSYQITSYDLEKNIQNKKYTKWWFDLWKNNNIQNKYITRLNPELTLFFKEKDEDFIENNLKIKVNRRLQDRYILSTNLSFHTDKAYIYSSFIDDDNRKNSIKQFNKIFNDKNTYNYFYGLDKGTNELISLGLFKKESRRLKSVNISSKVPLYKITKKGLEYFEYIKDKETGNILLDINGEKKKRYLAKNVSYFIKDLNNEELFKKLEIGSCLGNLTYAKLIKGNIILNADIFTTINLYKTTAKRFLYDNITKENFEGFDFTEEGEEKGFYYSYLRNGEEKKQIIFYWKDSFNLLPYNRYDFKSYKEEIQNELENYIDNLKIYLKNPKKYADYFQDNISIQKIYNYKNAISANIVGILVELQKKENFPGFICFETLDEGQILKKGNNTFIGNIINEKIYNRLQLNLEVPPILKKFRTDIGKKTIQQHGKVIYIDENNTSSSCPKCNSFLLKKDKDGNLIEKDDEEINKLYGHLKGELWEKNIHHCNKNCLDIEKCKGNSEICDYHMQNNNYGFSEIKSGDDLATYNIAKKGLEYI